MLMYLKKKRWIGLQRSITSRWREKSGEKFRGNDWSIYFKAWIGVQSLYIITILKHDHSA